MGEIEEENLWDLDITIAKFIEPRLRAFAQSASGYPDTNPHRVGFDSLEEWKAAVIKMADAFAVVKNGNAIHENEECKEGLDLFREHYFHLWD